MERNTFEAAITANPTEKTPYLVFADWLEEHGEHREAEALREKAPRLVTLAKVQERQPELLAQAHRDLALANGRRRARTLTQDDVGRAIVNAVAHGYWIVDCERVANNYGYASSQTVVIAVRRSDGRIAVAIGETSASKGASRTTWLEGIRDDKNLGSRLREWADRQDV